MEVNVSVAVRVRPPPLPTPERLGDHVNVATGPYPNVVTVNNIRAFQFDHVLPMDCSQSQLFESTVEPLIPYLLEGYDTSVVAYGQAGSGKSYTVLGPGPHCALSELEYGIVPRATREVFNRMRLYPERRFKIYVTFVEIYQEVVKDLLNPNALHSNLHIKEDPCVGMKVEGAEHIECHSTVDVFNCLLAGMSNRQQGGRAHTVFSLLVQQQIHSGDQVQQKVSQLLLVDLAGSERLCSEGSVRLDSSLAALGNLVHALATHQSYLTSLGSSQNAHLPYRDSKLTHLLKGSLGGRAITLFICCISAMASDMTDTLNTLSCGNLVKVVRNRPTMNHFVGTVPEILFDENRSQSTAASFADNLFGMEFVLLQWKKLICDAEGLFHQISESTGLSVDAMEHIQRWLCLKQECEEIVGSQQADSLGQLARRSLDVIGELSECEEKGEDEEEEDDSQSVSPAKSAPSNNQSDVELEPRRMVTPDLLNKLDYLMEHFKLKTDAAVQQIQDNDSNDLQHLNTNGNVAVMCAGPAQPCVGGRQDSLTPNNHTLQVPTVGANALAVTGVIGNELVELNSKLQSDGRHTQMKRVMLDLQGVNAKMDELQHTIHLKEAMLEALEGSSEVRLAAKQRLERKVQRTQDAYRSVQARLSQLERQPGLAATEHNKLCLALHAHKQRLRDMASALQLADDAPAKTADLERSLQASRRQLEKLKRQLRREEKLKLSVEREFQREEPEVQELHEEPKAAKEVLVSSHHSDEGGWQNNSSTNALSRSEPPGSCKSLPCGETLRDLHNTKEGSAMRRTIRKLRKTKDSLIAQRCELSSKLRLETCVSGDEERKLLELEEGIEAIDAAIEYKNELLCGRSQQLPSSTDKGESELMGHLVGLSLSETKMLLYKYFRKVVELRDSSRSLELQVAELETQAELQTWRFEAVSHVLQQSRYSTERQLVCQQRHHQDQLHLLLRLCAEECPSCSVPSQPGPNKMLRHCLGDTHLALHTHTSSHTSGGKKSGGMNVLAVPEVQLRRLQANTAVATTTISREKNKLVIQQHRHRRSP